MNFMSGRAGFYEDAIGSSRGMYSDEATEDSDDNHMRSGGAGDVVVIEREHMFDKVVTPSDVGKLNRLVIPKQHAEKYFPLDSSTNEKGLLLKFEDRNGKPWRFRYSYWNSSQSYVMTKGWSRFVKEKKLDAGDIVSFLRGVGDLAKDRLFINWRRRPDAVDLLPPHIKPNHFSFHPWNPIFSRDYSNLLQRPNAISTVRHPAPAYNYSTNPCPPDSNIYFRSEQVVAAGRHGAGAEVHAQRRSEADQQLVFDSVPVVQGRKPAPKRLRLFGVTMDCPISESEDECDILLSSTMQFQHFDSIPLPNSISSLQLRPYNNHINYDKGKSSMSLDLDI